MKFTREQSEGLYTVHAYRHGEVSVNALQGDEGRDEDGRLVLHRSFIISPHKLLQQWPVSAISHLKEEDLTFLCELEPEVLLLGTGRRLQFPTARQLEILVGMGVGYEVMDSAAACRTYNILVGEGRQVAACIIIERDEFP